MGCCKSSIEKAEFLLQEQKLVESEMTTGCDSPNFKYLQNNEADTPTTTKAVETPKFGKFTFNFNEDINEDEENFRIDKRTDYKAKGSEKNSNKNTQKSN
ncbi:unnamed protein product [Blepharisma stoltei]|uniref:Uncharacterized protein n=1 Tax=Blepharisma stoltei TaxID=1481888 RepID=A0AAU9IST0_9CILI|nr:unnamed protein product [Blepharisma stoltei]